MNTLEQKALPLVALMIGDGAQGFEPKAMLVDQSMAEAIAQWAAVVTVLRGELVPAVRSVNRTSIASLKKYGLGGIEAQVWAVQMEISRNSHESESPASVYWTLDDPNATGCVVLYFLRSLCIVVAVGDHVARTAAGVRILSDCAFQLWPAANSINWPRPRWVKRIELLNALGVGHLAPPEFTDSRPVSPTRVARMTRSD